MELAEIKDVTDRLRSTVGGVVMGQEDVVSLILCALLAEGHVLLEGVPGTAKTLMARTFARCLELDYGRIQFTPDMMPADVIGTNLFNFKTNEFVLSKGPIFAELLLADEINRTPPKTQAALLEAMQEHAVTIDGTTHELGDGFMVIATMNPIEQEGTYPLPEAQLDRFLFKIQVGYPSRDDERAMVSIHGNQTTLPRARDLATEPIANKSFLREARATVDSLHLSDEIIDYIVDIVRATREHPALLCGASPRAANMLASAARAWSALHGEDYVVPDTVKFLATPVLAHRMVLSPGAEIEGQTTATVIRQVIEQVPAPR